MVFLVFVGPGGTLRCSWAELLLLRDNVQHHLEGGVQSGDYPVLHAIVDQCLSAEGTAAQAGPLLAEIRRASAVLAGIPISMLAVSFRTDAMFSSGAVPPQDRGTVLMRLTPGHLVFPVFRARTIADAFRGVLDGLPRLASGSGHSIVRVSAATPRVRSRSMPPQFDPRKRLS